MDAFSDMVGYLVVFSVGVIVGFVFREILEFVQGGWDRVRRRDHLN